MADTIYPTGIIYKITNTINGKFYVGQTTYTIHKRWNEHKGNAARESKYYLARAIRKSGSDNFIVEVIEDGVPVGGMDEREIHWIANLRPHYNMTTGGDGVRGWVPSKETKAKIGAKSRQRLSDKTNHPFYGRRGAFFGHTHNEETKKRMSEAHKNKPRSDQHRIKLSNAAKLRVGEKNSMFGRKHTTEAKAIMSAATKKRTGGPDNPMFGRKHSEESKSRMRETRAKTKLSRDDQRLNNLGHEVPSRQEKLEPLNHCSFETSQ